jgi:hypothetical protein
MVTSSPTSTSRGLSVTFGVVFDDVAKSEEMISSSKNQKKRQNRQQQTCIATSNSHCRRKPFDIDECHCLVSFLCRRSLHNNKHHHQQHQDRNNKKKTNNTFLPRAMSGACIGERNSWRRRAAGRNDEAFMSCSTDDSTARRRSLSRASPLRVAFGLSVVVCCECVLCFLLSAISLPFVKNDKMWHRFEVGVVGRCVVDTARQSFR